MKLTIASSLWLSLAPTVLSQSGVSDDPKVFGNVFNFWTKLSPGWDLTRGNKANAITLPMPKNGPIVIQPNKTALVIIDMQNFFLHESLGGDPLGRAIVPTTVDMIHAFRNAGMPVLWTNWGLTEFDLINMPPSFINGFTSDGTSVKSFGSDMGSIVVPKSDPSIPATSKTQGGNQTIAVGRKLMRGSWNAQPWGALLNEQVQGVAKGTDFYFNKNRLSGMWGAGTPMQTWLQDNSMTTLFFGGVNIDQCVWGTLLDSFYKGYDVILMDDISATTSPIGATQMVDFNAQLNGWRANSTDILGALKKAAKQK
ncbi:Ureidoacrylate amidohydrolase RutB [Psilocybe cubensis]|uniref:Isochorismatase-like domain-containing protein n=2 Tax=Psilocybe cubensis TaxID=181762 RepID=A0A8H7XSU1_PSICU|nr:Ureidoacrylate amidohydrolase RutB [Psilocybe cubensis]KAH9480816.1 Ureidoacrylate amidohydrolase RutB [Psilocybe cubensis]